MRKLFFTHIFIFAFILFLKSQTTSTLFGSVDLEDGLSQSTIYSMIQDHQGLIWIGTQDGLNCYDGYSFKVFRYSPQDTSSITNSSIKSLYLDFKHRIWIGTEVGINFYNPETGNFTNTFKHLPVNNEVITCLVGDSKNNLWIGTESNGIIHCQLDQLTFEYINQKNNAAKLLPGNHIHCMLFDSNGTLWVGTDSGLCYHEPKTDIFVKVLYDTGIKYNVLSIIEGESGVLWIATSHEGLLLYDTKNRKLLSSYMGLDMTTIKDHQINTLLRDHFNSIWIGTENNGLYQWNVKTKRLRNYKALIGNNSLHANKISALMEDYSGNLWIGNIGINVLSLIPPKFELYRPNTLEFNELSSSLIRSFTKDKDDNLWVGTKDQGIFVFDKKENLLHHYFEGFGGGGNLNGNMVFSIFKDSENTIWVGTNKGLNRYNTKSSSFQHVHLIESIDCQNGISLIVRKIIQDHEKNLWIATDGDGIFKYNIQTLKCEQFIHHDDHVNSLAHNKVYFIMQDQKRNIWAITHGGGISKMNYNNKKFTSYSYQANTKGINDNHLITALEDNNGNIWIGAQEGGLNILNPETNEFSFITINDGLTNNCIYAVLQDNKGNIWASHNKGLSCIEPGSKKIVNYSITDGLQSDEFYGNAAFKDKDGKLYFGGINGFNAFYPDSIRPNNTVPKLIIKNLTIDNVIIIPNQEFNGRIILNQSLPYTKSITLKHFEKTIHIEYAALHYQAPEKNQYAYILEGFDKEWNHVGNRRIATYSNLPPGKYTFKVIASNSDGIWNNEGISFEIIVKPAIWETMLFKIVVVLVFLIIVSLIVRIRLNYLKQHNAHLENIVNTRTADLQGVNVLLEEHQAELEQQKEEISAQKDLLENQNKKISKQRDEILAQRDEIQKYMHELEKLSIVASKTDNAVLIADKSGDIEWVNSGFQKLYEHSLIDFKRKYGSNLFNTSNNPNIRELKEWIFEEKKSVIYESQLMKSDGQKIWLQTTLTPILDEKDEIKGFIAIDTDIQRHKEAELRIKKQNKELETKNQIISESINFAKTLQNSILPNLSQMDDDFEVTVFSKSKTELSGEFYWHYSPELGTHYFAVIDVTGSNIAAAFLTLLCNDFLKEILTYEAKTNPIEIVEELDRKFVSDLKQIESNNVDGLDIVLCKIQKNKENYRISSVGANRPFVYFDSDANQIIVEKGCGKTVGGFYPFKEELQFKQNEFELNKNDIIYLTSDGVSNQFDFKKQKFGSQRFYGLLQKIAKLTLDEQMNILSQNYESFWTDTTQDDDLTVLAIKL